MSETSAALLAAVVTATPQIAALVAPSGDVVWLNQAFVTRWPCADHPHVEGLLDVVHPDDHALVSAAWDLVSTGGVHTTTRRVRLGCSHERRPGHIRLTRVEGGAADGSIVVHVEQIDGVSSGVGLDPLTGLANRQGLMSQMDATLDASGCYGLLVFDLDDFHLINNTLGHTAGDDVLIAVARRLRHATDPLDVVARLGGDEFAVLVCSADEPIDAVVDRLREEISRPVAVAGTTLELKSSVGVALPEVMSSTIEGLAAADWAMFLARARGGGRVEIYDAGLRDSAMRILRRTTELRQAAANGELILRYQPIVDLTSGVTIGCEALLRWNHPTEGELSAGDFIDIAESSGLINELTGVLLSEACLAAQRLLQLHRGAAPYVAVNLSPRQLTDPRLVGQVDAAIKRAGIDAGQLMLEITERGVVTDVAGAVATLTALRERGVRIALDDFGTGFSSLLRLRDLPVDCLKIDRAFVNGILRSSDDLAIVASVISMASTLGVDCVAEGVETEEQAEQLRRLGCTRGQGFLFSAAVPMADLPLKPGIEPRKVRRSHRVGAFVAPNVAARILQLHRSGASLHSIAAILNQEGLRTQRGTRWHPRTVADVVSHDAYPDLD